MVCLHPKRRCTKVNIKNEKISRVGTFQTWTHLLMCIKLLVPGLASLKLHHHWVNFVFLNYLQLACIPSA